MNEKEVFYNLTNIKVIKSRKIKTGITNINYKILTNEGVFVLRIPRKGIEGISFINQAKVLNVVKDINVDVVYYDFKTGILISKYVEKQKQKKVSFNVVIDILKKLHNLPIENIDRFDPFKLIKLYKSIALETEFVDEKNIINKAKKLYKKYPLCFCHNDLLYANFLKSKERYYLIDYEYAGLNIALFDIASFLSENNINDKKLQVKFIKKYFNYFDDSLYEDITTMFNLLDLLWYYWASALYKLYKEEIFNIIALEKKEHLLSRCYNS